MARSKQKKVVQEESEGEEYEVEKFLEHRRTKKKGLEYHVKWKGYSAEHNSWEPAENVSTADVLLAKYWKGKTPAEQLDRYNPGTHDYRKFIKQHPEVDPAASAGKSRRKSSATASGSASPAKAKATPSRKRSAPADEEEEDEEDEGYGEGEEDAKAEKKKKTTKRATPQKKKTAQPAAKRARKSEPEPEPEVEEEADEEAESAGEEEGEEEEKASVPAAAELDAIEDEWDEMIDWQELPFKDEATWEDHLSVVTVKMEGTIAAGLTGAARIEAERKCRETQMLYLVKLNGYEGGRTASNVPNLVLKKKAPQAIIRFFEGRIKFRRQGAGGGAAEPEESGEASEQEEEGDAVEEEENSAEEVEDEKKVAANGGNADAVGELVDENEAEE